MHHKINLFVMPAIALFTVILFAACDSTPSKPPANFSAGNLSGPQNTSPSNAANNANQIVLRRPDGLPNVARGEDYRRLRLKMLDGGWSPARSEKEGRENCANVTDACKEFPELESGPLADEGRTVFRWKLGDKFVLIYGVDDPVVYESHKFEKVVTPKPSPSARPSNENSKPTAKPANNSAENKQDDADTSGEDESGEPR